MPLHRGGRWRGGRPTRGASSRSTGSEVSRSLRRSSRRYEIRIDTAFADVVERVRRPRASGRLDQRGIRPPTASCTGSGGPTASRPGTTTGWPAGSTAWRWAACSPASRCSIAAATHRRWRWSRSSSCCATTASRRLLDVQWTTDHLASLGARGRAPDRATSSCSRRAAVRPAVPGRGAVPFVADRAAGGSLRHDRVAPGAAGSSVDDPHLLGALHGQGEQRALPHQPGQGPDRPVDRLRPAHPDRVRPRPRPRQGRGRQGRRAGGAPRPHGRAARRHPRRRDEHVDDDQRARRRGCSASTSPTPRTRACRARSCAAPPRTTS